MKIVIHYTKKSAAVAFAIIILVVGAIVITVARNDSSTTSPRIATPPSSVATQPTDEGPVDVAVEHDAKQSTATTHQFTVTLNTHAGDLSTFDAQSNIVYRIQEGQEMSPQSIGGDKETHHRTIIVTFNDITIPGTLKIKNLRGVSERAFPITL